MTVAYFPPIKFLRTIAEKEETVISEIEENLRISDVKPTRGGSPLIKQYK